MSQQQPQQVFVVIPEPQWYQFIDRFTRIDELLVEMLKTLDAIREELPKLVEQMDYVEPVIYTGKVGTTPMAIEQSTIPFWSLLIHNTHSLNTLYVYFNGEMKQVAAGASLPMRTHRRTQFKLQRPMRLQGSAADTTYELVFVRTFAEGPET